MPDRPASPLKPTFRPMVSPLVAALIALAALSGCVTRYDYRPPSAPTSGRLAEAVVMTPQREVERAIAAGALGQAFSVRPASASGQYEVRYRGDPEPYVDCGFREFSSDPDSEKASWVPAARAQLTAHKRIGAHRYKGERRLLLEAAARLVLTGGGPDTTMVRLDDIAYTLSRSIVVESGTGTKESREDAIRFGSAAGASFDRLGSEKLACVANGRFTDALLAQMSGIGSGHVPAEAAAVVATPVYQVPDADHAMGAPSGVRSNAVVVQAEQRPEAKRPDVKRKVVARSTLPARGRPVAKPPMQSSVVSEQYRNPNKDPLCKRIVDHLFALDRHPRFNYEQSIRKQWQRQADWARANGCDY